MQRAFDEESSQTILTGWKGVLVLSSTSQSHTPSTMDPVAIVGSALNVLNQIKKQIKDCEEAFAKAAELNAQLG